MGYNIVEHSNIAATNGGFFDPNSILYNTRYGITLTTETRWTKTAIAVSGSLSLSDGLADNSTTNGTETLALPSGSFAIDAGINNDPRTTDQRGMARSGTTDIGADEYTGPVPVTLTSFTAKIVDETVLLNWETATEINNYGFDIERSGISSQISEKEWEVLSFVQGHGNSNSPKHYEFVDETPLADSAEYRLKQIDTDGAFTYYAQTVKVSGYGITDVEEVIPTEFSLVQNYPNPFNPSIVINYSLPRASNVQLIIYNMLGQEVAILVNTNQEAGKFSVEFNASNLTSGIYFYSINVSRLLIFHNYFLSIS